ncbi:hypothetical protein ACODT5_21300 [Streptomyces sp. 5.8]|uniref:hypothetical protein n=1 Tax=Streptomyces sp. 5.8 TaxID=3406571 RepID=UPI003BB58CEB
MTDVTAGADGADSPAPVDRLDPAARPYADALASFFPDLGGRVTDAGEARRILAAVPATARPAVVGAVEDREAPGPAGAPPAPLRVDYPDSERWPGSRPTVVFCHGDGWALAVILESTARNPGARYSHW